MNQETKNKLFLTAIITAMILFISLPGRALEEESPYQEGTTQQSQFQDDEEEDPSAQQANIRIPTSDEEDEEEGSTTPGSYSDESDSY